MRTSLLEIKQLENHLLQESLPGDRLSMDARLILDNTLRENREAQKTAYLHIQAYGRKQLRREIKAVEHKIFHSKKYTGWRNRIRHLFGLHL